MTTKKKRKSTLDAIDKYLQRKRYSQGKQFEKKEKPTKKVGQLNVSKISSGLYSTTIRSKEENRKSVRTLKVQEPKSVSSKLRKRKLTKNDTDEQPTNNTRLKTNVKKLPKPVVQKTSRTRSKTAVVPPTKTQNANRKNLRVSPKQLRSRKGKNDGIELSKESTPKGKTIRQNLKNSIKDVRVAKKDLSKKKSNSENLLKSKTIRQNLKNSIKDVRVAKKDLSKKKSNSENLLKNKSSGKKSKKKVQVARTAKTIASKKSKRDETVEDSPAVHAKVTSNAYLVPNDTCDSQQENQVTDVISEPSTVTNKVADTGKRTLGNADSCLPKKKRKIVIDDQPTKTNSSDAAHEPSCSYNDDIAPSLQGENIDSEITEEITPITKKYQPYMERLKLLSSDVIEKFIRDNQQYYVNYKKEIESKGPNVPLPGKKRKKYDEMRESFKCNPFNSDQQLAMYYTLREIFEVPKTQFVECRNLFTVLLPEISCQLFAETFHIKVSFAPRLIKKLYPNPVCPV